MIYFLSDFLFIILFEIAGYRRKVVFENLRNAFPEKTDEEIKTIARKFYRHLCDLIFESLRMFSVSETTLKKRMRSTNPELLLKYFQSKQNLIIAGGHYNNWEMCAVAVPFMFSHDVLGIFKPLNNSFFNKKMKQSRGRFGTALVPMKEIKDSFQAGFKKPTAVFFIIDQSPSNVARGYWTRFLNQDTCFMTGAGRFAVEYKIPVLFGRIEKVKRGFYTVTWKEVNTAGLSVESIMQELILQLEQEIESAPEYWLWSHRRWKHKKQNAAVNQA